jgi:hypothetical protein
MAPFLLRPSGYRPNSALEVPPVTSPAWQKAQLCVITLPASTGSAMA